MKMQELSARELKEINGGGFLSGNDSSSENGLGSSLGIGNLLSFSNSSTDGDESQSSSFSLGNGINLDVVSIAKKVIS